MSADEPVTCTRCGALVPAHQYYDGEHDRDACRQNRGLVPCDSAICLAKDNPMSREEFKDAYAHWRWHSHMGGCSHGN